MLTLIYRVAIALMVTMISLGLVMGFQILSEAWLAIVILLERFVGSAFAGIIGVVLVTPITFLLLYGFKDPRK